VCFIAVKNVYVHVGDNTSLLCSDAGPHNVEWTTPTGAKSENPLPLPNIQTSDSGIYDCHYFDGPTTHHLDSYYLNVTGKHTYLSIRVSNMFFLILRDQESYVVYH